MNAPQNVLSQLFLLIAPKERKFSGYGDELIDAIGTHRAEELVRLLAVPLKSHERRNSFSFHRKTAAAEPNRRIATGELVSLAILRLPVEVQHMIFGCLDNVEDQMCLGLTCTYFWSMALPYMHDRWASKMGLWAGKNLVLVGAHTEASDLPPGLFLDEEKAALVLPTIGETLHPRSLTLYELGKPNHSRGQPLYKCDVPHTWYSSFMRGVDRNLTEDLSPCGALSRRGDIDDLEENDFYPIDEPWILRNLTAKRFVRAEAIALEPGFVHGPKIQGLGFGHVVLARICWSSEPVTQVSSPVDVTRGVWAGHCFDIIPVARHKKDTEGEEWVDVSQEVADEMNIVYTGLYGSAWKERFINDRVEGQDALLTANPSWRY